MDIIETFKTDAIAVWDAIEPVLLADLLGIAESVVAGILTGGVTAITGGHLDEILTGILNHAEDQLRLDIVNLESVLLQSVVSTFVASKAAAS